MDTTTDGHYPQLNLDDALLDSRIQKWLKRRFSQYVCDRCQGDFDNVDWPQLAKLIKQRTGVLFKHDKLRQNFRPKNAKISEKSRNFRQLEDWRALHDYLTHDEVLFMAPNELPLLSQPAAPFILLNEFLRGSIQLASEDYRSRFTGCYDNLRDADATLDFEIRLDIDTPSHGGKPVTLRISSEADLDSNPFDCTSVFNGAMVEIGDGQILILRERNGGKSKCFTVVGVVESEYEEGGYAHIGLEELLGYRDAAISAEHAATDISSDGEEEATDIDLQFKFELESAETRDIIFLTRTDEVYKTLGTATRFGFVGNYGAIKSPRIEELMDGVQKDNIDETFIELVAERRYGRALELMPNVSDINIVHSEHGMNAWHFAAAFGVFKLIEALQTRDDLDYLQRDRDGNSASELAWDVCANEGLSQELMALEYKAGQDAGVDPWPRRHPAPTGP